MYDKRIKVHRVLTLNLPTATDKMTCDHGIFKARVVDIKFGEVVSFVAVEYDGYYPYVTNQWDFILSEDRSEPSDNRIDAVSVVDDAVGECPWMDGVAGAWELLKKELRK